MALQASSASVLIDRSPRSHEPSASLKAGTAVALITDHERKAVSIRVPYFHVFDATDDADELHGHSTHERLPFGKGRQARQETEPESRRSCGAS
jgi:hypothetical protein